VYYTAILCHKLVFLVLMRLIMIKIFNLTAALVKSMYIFSIYVPAQNIYSHYIFASIMLMSVMFSINISGKYIM